MKSPKTVWSQLRVRVHDALPLFFHEIGCCTFQPIHYGVLMISDLYLSFIMLLPASGKTQLFEGFRGWTSMPFNTKLTDDFHGSWLLE